METITYDLGNYELNKYGKLFADGAYIRLTDELTVGLDYDGDFAVLSSDEWNEDHQPDSVEEYLEQRGYDHLFSKITWEMACDMADQLEKSIEDTEFDEISCCNKAWWSLNSGSAHLTRLGNPFSDIIIYGINNA